MLHLSAKLSSHFSRQYNPCSTAESAPNRLISWKLKTEIHPCKHLFEALHNSVLFRLLGVGQHCQNGLSVSCTRKHEKLTFVVNKFVWMDVRPDIMSHYFTSLVNMLMKVVGGQFGSVHSSATPFKPFKFKLMIIADVQRLSKNPRTEINWDLSPKK